MAIRVPPPVRGESYSGTVPPPPRPPVPGGSARVPPPVPGGAASRIKSVSASFEKSLPPVPTPSSKSPLPPPPAKSSVPPPKTTPPIPNSTTTSSVAKAQSQLFRDPSSSSTSTPSISPIRSVSSVWRDPTPSTSPNVPPSPSWSTMKLKQVGDRSPSDFPRTPSMSNLSPSTPEKKSTPDSTTPGPPPRASSVGPPPPRRSIVSLSPASSTKPPPVAPRNTHHRAVSSMTLNSKTLPAGGLNLSALNNPSPQPNRPPSHSVATTPSTPTPTPTPPTPSSTLSTPTPTLTPPTLTPPPLASISSPPQPLDLAPKINGIKSNTEHPPPVKAASAPFPSPPQPKPRLSVSASTTTLGAPARPKRNSLTKPPTPNGISTSFPPSASDLKEGSSREDTTDLLPMPEIVEMDPQSIAVAFLVSEKNYLENSLQHLVFSYERRLRVHIEKGRPILDAESIDKIFLDISSLYKFNYQLYNDLLTLLRQGGPQGLLEGIGGVMMRVAPFFRLYAKYVEAAQSPTGALQTLKFHRMQNSNFDYFIRHNEVSTMTRLSNLIRAPSVRLAQYLQFLAGLYAKCRGTGDFTSALETAMELLNTTMVQIVKILDDSKQRGMVLVMQQNFFSNSCNLLSPTRYVVKIGNVKLWGGSNLWTTMALALCNDMLLYGQKAGRLTKGKVELCMQLYGIVVQDVPEDILPNSFRIKSRFKKPFVMRCRDKKDKSLWISAIWTQVRKAEDKLEASGRAGSSVLSQASAEEFENHILKKTVPKKKYATLSRGFTSPKNDFKDNSSSTSTLNTSTRTNFKLWLKIWDDRYSTYYYENQETGESRWERPDAYVSDDEKETSSPKPSTPTPAPTPAPTPTPAPPLKNSTPTPSPPTAISNNNNNKPGGFSLFRGKTTAASSTTSTTSEPHTSPPISDLNSSSTTVPDPPPIGAPPPPTISAPPINKKTTPTPTPTPTPPVPKASSAAPDRTLSSDIPDAPPLADDAPPPPIFDSPTAPTSTPATTASSQSPKWLKIWDDGYQAFYYENQETYESVWEPPPDYVEPDETLTTTTPPPPLLATGGSTNSNSNSDSGSGGGGGSGDSRDNLLSAIRGAGIGSLKKTQATPRPEQKSPAPSGSKGAPGAPGTPSLSLENLVKQSLTVYRKAVATEEADDDGGDDDWD